MTRRELSEVLALLAELPLVNAPKEITSATLEAYFFVLSDLAIEDVKAAVRRLTATSKWWPAVSDIRSDVARARLGIADAEDVLEEILEAVREHGYTKPPKPGMLSAVAAAVVATMGWRTICDSENPEALRAHALRLAQRFSEKAIAAGNLASAGVAPSSPSGAVERHLPASIGDIVRGVLPALPRNAT